MFTDEKRHLVTTWIILFVIMLRDLEADSLGISRLELFAGQELGKNIGSFSPLRTLRNHDGNANGSVT